uniref:Uncharacterized protein n=1 Tax=Lepeophtheirus salmonis TaxID=72036 RepID=A0A0K2UCH6_LEPSM
MALLIQALHFPR